MNIAETLKKQTDSILRQRSTGPTGGGAIIVEDPTDGSTIVNNPANPTWASISGKPATFPPDAHGIMDHDDAPATMTGQAGKALVVKSTEDGFEFAAAGGGGGAGAFDFGLITEAAGSSTAQDWGSIA